MHKNTSRSDGENFIQDVMTIIGTVSTSMSTVGMRMFPVLSAVCASKWTIHCIVWCWTKTTRQEWFRHAHERMPEGTLEKSH